MTTKKHLLAFYSPKGGSGKTTISTQCAASATRAGKVVAFYDLDQQKSATFYLSKLPERFKPKYILHDINEAPPDDSTHIMLDCAPNVDFIPPKEFTIIAPTLTNSLDLHAYRKIFELEQMGYNVIRVINKFSLITSTDKDIKEQLDPCILLSVNAAVTYAMNNGLTLWNNSYSNPVRARNQFNYLISRIIEGSAETLTLDEFNKISFNKRSKSND